MSILGKRQKLTISCRGKPVKIKLWGYITSKRLSFKIYKFALKNLYSKPLVAGLFKGSFLSRVISQRVFSKIRNIKILGSGLRLGKKRVVKTLRHCPFKYLLRSVPLIFSFERLTSSPPPCWAAGWCPPSCCRWPPASTPTQPSRN